MLYRFCAEHNIPHKKTGKLLVATDLLEEEYLEDVYRTAVENQVPGVETIDGNKVTQYEPNVKAVSALYVPTSGIIESTDLVDKLYRLAESYGVTFLVGNEVFKIEPEGKGFKVKEENYYLDMVRLFFPGLKLEDISLHQAGIRARLKDYYDFIIERDPKYTNLINLVGIDSPGLTASLAIARYVSELLGR